MFPSAISLKKKLRFVSYKGDRVRNSLLIIAAMPFSFSSKTKDGVMSQESNSTNVSIVFSNIDKFDSSQLPFENQSQGVIFGYRHRKLSLCLWGLSFQYRAFDNIGNRLSPVAWRMFMKSVICESFGISAKVMLGFRRILLCKREALIHCHRTWWKTIKARKGTYIISIYVSLASLL